MNVEFKSNKLKKICEDPKVAQKEHGANIGKKIIQRINEITAAVTLEDISKMSIMNGFHELDGERSGQFAVTLVHPHRLVFTSIPKKSHRNNEISYNDITIVKIEEVCDYHGKKKKK